MEDFELKETKIAVPKNTGIEGFVTTLRSVLKLPRVKSVHIDDKGTVTYARYVKEDEPVGPGIDFEGLEPWHIIRQLDTELEELIPPFTNASSTVAAMLDMALSERLQPTAFVSGVHTTLWRWFELMAGNKFRSKDSIFGLPLYLDKDIPNDTLILCAAYLKGAALVDTCKAYKIAMDYQGLATAQVEIL